MKRSLAAALAALWILALLSTAAAEGLMASGFGAANLAQSDGMKLPAPGDGERLFIGMTPLSSGARMYAALLLSANGRSVRCVSLHASDVSAQAYGQTFTFSYSIMSGEDKDIPIDPTGDTIDFGESRIAELAFDGDTAECVVSFTCGYKVPNSSETGTVRLEDTRMRLGGTGGRAVRAAPAPLAAEAAAAALDKAMAAGVQLPAAEAGEALYIGAANASQAQEMYAAFVLEADGGHIRGLTVWAFGVDFAFFHQGKGTRLTGDASAVWLSQSFALGEGDVETELISLRNLAVEGDAASGELQYRTKVLNGALVYPFDLCGVAFTRQG